jgi:TPR repeat protein
MGVSYFNGVGVGVDKAESLKWYRLAAAQGNANAQFNLGAAYSKGEGVSIDKVEGLKWIKLAAENGSQEAISFLKSYQQ